MNTRAHRRSSGVLPFVVTCGHPHLAMPSATPYLILSLIRYGVGLCELKR